MELFAIAVTILAGVLTYLTWRNGRWMKQAHEDTTSLIKQSHQDTLAILERIEKGQDETRKEMAEAIKYLAQLVVSESEKTRQVRKDQS